jgi:hypothetical protein
MSNESPSPLTARVTPEMLQARELTLGLLDAIDEAMRKGDQLAAGEAFAELRCAWRDMPLPTAKAQDSRLTARVTPFVTCGDGCRDPICCRQNQQCLMVEVAKAIAAQQQPDLTARVTARLTDEVMDDCRLDGLDSLEGYGHEACRKAMRVAILTAIAPELQDAEKQIDAEADACLWFKERFERQDAELEMLDKIIGPQGYPDLELVERAVLLRKQMDADEARVVGWQKETEEARLRAARINSVLQRHLDGEDIDLFEMVKRAIDEKENQK